MDNLAYQEPPRVERIEGKTYLMSPRPRMPHNRAGFNIANIFANYLKGKTCVAFGDGTDVFLDDENWYIPDAMIVCDRSIIKNDGVHGAPDLVVEVLSPSTAKNDRGPKMRHYAEAGVKEYWLVTPTEKLVEVYYNAGGHFEIHETYAIYEDWELRQMNEEERAAAKTEIPVSLYDDFFVSLEDIFWDVDAFQ
ncbi:Uma2 family endonuclease [uncultured Selenomonas sp.]|uniref:Uma2 family endonuclease n=1 Tax=uncultured Selenomonas sp. TaxID=159275 RepID=UPI0025F0B040|nr:Uma2 family endonuclease [uncultured Selenomonas sp.]